MKFTHLFSPIKINNLIVQNRIIMAPGRCGGELMAEAGTGIVYVRCDLANPSGKRDIFNEDHMALRQKINEAHASGAVACGHIHHFGLHSYKAKGPSDGWDDYLNRPYTIFLKERMPNVKYAKMVKESCKTWLSRLSERFYIPRKRMRSLQKVWLIWCPCPELS